MKSGTPITGIPKRIRLAGIILFTRLFTSNVIRVGKLITPKNTRITTAKMPQFVITFIISIRFKYKNSAISRRYHYPLSIIGLIEFEL